MSNSNHKKPTKEQQFKINELYKSGKKVKEIATELGFNQRQIRIWIKRFNRNQTPFWTQEEVNMLKYLYSLGYVKPSQLRNFIRYKDDYSIRNKIQSLKNKGLLTVVNMVELQPTTVIQEQPITTFDEFTFEEGYESEQDFFLDDGEF